MATLKELSERTGYSPATISRILTGDPALTVTDEARKRVLEEAGRLNYAATRSRRGRQPKMLLRVAAAEMLTPEEQLSDPYYLYLRNFVEDACRESRYSFQLLERDGARFLPPADPPPDGIVAIGIFDPEQIALLKRLSPNLVFLDSSPDERCCDSVVLNYRLGIAQAVEHLLSQGHRAIGFLGPAEKLDDWKRPAPEERRRLFAELMAGAGVQNPLFLEAPMEARASAGAVGEYLRSGKPRPTALICANEENALGAHRAILDCGLSVPGDISLVSFNDTPLSELTEPPLTSVAAHGREMARTAVRLLAQRCPTGDRGPARTLPQKVIVPPTLVLRGSVKQC